MQTETTLLSFYETLVNSLGTCDLPYSGNPFERAVCILLSQNGCAGAGRKSLQHLQSSTLVEPEVLCHLSTAELDGMLRPLGNHAVKARRLRQFLDLLHRMYDMDMSALVHTPRSTIRDQLLELKGIGPETADTLLLFALDLPSFPVNGSTYRIMHRHGLAYEEMDYHSLQSLFMDVLPQDVSLYQQYHAQLARIGRGWCKPSVRKCETCPLQAFLDQ